MAYKIERAPVCSLEEIIRCKCGGQRNYIGHSVSDSFTTRHLHICNKCGKDIWLSEIYPRIVHERTPSPTEGTGDGK